MLLYQSLVDVSQILFLYWHIKQLKYKSWPISVSSGLKDDPIEPLVVNLTVPDTAAPVHALPFQWQWVIVSTCWRWCPEAPQPCLPQAMELFHWGECGHREPGDKNATGFKIHRYIQEAELQWSRVFSSVIVVWLCSSASLLSFVQMGQILFVSLTKFSLFLWPNLSCTAVHFVCACYGGYRPLISVSHLEGLQSPASALLIACLSWGTPFQRVYWTQIK